MESLSMLLNSNEGRCGTNMLLKLMILHIKYLNNNPKTN